MPIFSNRSLVSMLGDLPDEIRGRCQADLVGRLSGDGHEALAAEWELFTLRQLAKGGRLCLAPASQPGVPDAIFEPSGLGPLVVEVTALSDRDLEETFADDALGTLFYRAITRVTGRHVGSIDVHTNWPLEPTGLPVPGLPPRSQLHQFMKTPEVRTFIRTVASTPTELHTFEHRVGDATTTAVFRPGAQFASGPTSGYSARRFNPHNRGRLLRKLRKKVKQLASANLRMPSVVILCDADCRMLREPSRSLRSHGGTAVDAIFDFISGKPAIAIPGSPWMLQQGVRQQTTSISAVVVMSIEEHWNYWAWPRTQRNLKLSVIRNEGQAKHALSDNALEALVNSLARDVPPILRAPMNAKRTHPLSDNEGGGEVTGSRVRLSLLAVQDLLTGRTTHEKFAQRHGFIAEHLVRLASRGQCISGARVIPDEQGNDDDWIELDFSGIDPRDLRRLSNRSDG